MATKKKNDGIEHLPQHIHEILYNNDIPIIIKYFTFQYIRYKFGLYRTGLLSNNLTYEANSKTR